ncbi:hypothetical protein [Actibacterium pelagium]|uniref:Uncharacterized protein n=1 Tax=Actibacterium pelagium TaxID=2029103 RepID=A0A917EHP5_9RHOB|nr:hypothetical protein [Actibacterium pelagium]GGE37370.1 hypothetical protein GCM10011517_01380 [Actibacterium pelagium]
MSLQDALDAALESVPDCKVVGYIDISSGLVLRKAVETPVAQEILDRIASVASALWQGTQLPGFVAEQLKLSEPSDGLFLLAAPRQTYLFAQSPKHEEHAICFRCGTDIKAAELFKAAKPAIKAISNAF